MVSTAGQVRAEACGEVGEKAHSRDTLSACFGGGTPREIRTEKFLLWIKWGFFVGPY